MAPSTARPRGRLAIALGLGAVGALLLFTLLPAREEEGVPTPHHVADGAARHLARDAAAASNSQEAGSPAPERGEAPALARLPGSLADTTVDGALPVDEAGHLLVHRDVLAFFDYFFVASGEESPAEIRARILAAIRERLGSPAREEAIALLDTYTAFREDARRLTEAGEAPVDLERRFQWLRELRRTHFGGEAAVELFDRHEETLRVDLERRRIDADDSLSREERDARLAALESELPPDVREARRRAHAPRKLRAEVEALREAGASESAIFALREERFGSEAAERLAALDARREAWQRRLDRYAELRGELLAEAEARGATPEATAEAIDALRAAHFDAAEQRRVRALEADL